MEGCILEESAYSNKIPVDVVESECLRGNVNTRVFTGCAPSCAPSCGLEGQARHEHVLDERRRGHKVLQLEVEDALQALHAQGPELGQLAQQPRQVVVLLLGLRVVRHVVLERADDLHLQLLHLVGLLEAVALCDEGERAQAGEGGDVHLHVVQRLAEVQDGEQPVAEAPVALLLVQDHAVAERELGVLGPRPIR